MDQVTRGPVVALLSAFDRWRTRRWRYESMLRDAGQSFRLAEPAAGDGVPQAFTFPMPTYEQWSEHRASRLAYPQTWNYMPLPWRRSKDLDEPPRRPWSYPILRTLQALCGALIGHELSKTESGYAGGGMMDRWCRWCNRMFQVPIAEEPSKQWMAELFSAPPPTF